MELKANSSEKKLRGSYYTPKELAEIMVQMIDIDRAKSILEPSCGDGVFVDALKKHIPEAKITAIEIEKSEADSVKKRYKEDKRVNVINEDFFDFYEEKKKYQTYDYIIGNPPYIRYQYLSEEQRKIQAEILTSQGMKANKLINAWVAFTVASIKLLNKNGTILFVIPAELFQVAYAEDLRLFLANNLSNMTIITFKELVFPDIEQEVVVLIGEKKSEQSGIRIVEVSNVEDIKKVDLNTIRFQPISHEKEKWTKYFVTANEMDLLSQIRRSELFNPFSKYGTINVGITTGNNKFFSIDRDVEEQFELAEATMPLIGRSAHAHGIYFTEEDWENNIRDNKKALLLNFPDIPYEEYPTGFKRYIEYGENNEENKGYKCSIRDRWYIVPSIWVPDAFFLRRNNLFPKFVLNRCNAVSTDTMHRMKINDGVDNDLLLLSYYNSITFAFTEICGRSYGGGVLEILPGEMGRIMLPNITELDEALKTELLHIVDNTIRNGEDIESALNIVDQRLLIERLGVPEEWCSACRSIWKKLQSRRLNRGKQ
jgi:adenine-specific DNA-methyltransferase